MAKPQQMVEECNRLGRLVGDLQRENAELRQRPHSLRLLALMVQDGEPAEVQAARALLLLHFPLGKYNYGGMHE
jgi:hypothetical protein